MSLFTIKQIEEHLEKHPNSPLFLRLADEYLKSGRINSAHEMCISGMQRYPGYSTAKIILAKCHAAKNCFAEAAELIQSLVGYYPDSVILNNLLVEWSNKLKTQDEPENIVIPVTDIVEEITPEKELIALVSEVKTQQQIDITISQEIYVEEPQVEVEEQNSFSAGLPEFIPQLEIESEILVAVPEPIIVTPEPEAASELLHTSDINDDGSRIVSKTLAEIFARQGIFDEAILTYKLLKRKKPQDVDEIDKRIQELEIELQNRTNKL